jgi:hypothetical protein
VRTNPDFFGRGECPQNKLFLKIGAILKIGPMARKVELMSAIRMHPMMTMSPTSMNKLMIYMMTLGLTTQKLSLHLMNIHFSK